MIRHFFVGNKILLKYSMPTRIIYCIKEIQQSQPSIVLYQNGDCDLYDSICYNKETDELSGSYQEPAGRSNRPTWRGARLHRRPRH